MDFKDLTPEQMEKAKACKSSEELIALVKSEGVELSDEQLNAISGGETLWEVFYDEDCANHSVCWGLSV